MAGVPARAKRDPGGLLYSAGAAFDEDGLRLRINAAFEALQEEYETEPSMRETGENDQEREALMERIRAESGKEEGRIPSSL